MRNSQVNYQCTLEEYYGVAGRKGGSFGALSTVSTPAKAVPGYLARPRPSHVLASTARGTSPSFAPTDARPVTSEAPEGAETPVPSSSKSWIQPRDKLQKPFKLPGRSPATASLSVDASQSASPMPSKLREPFVPEQPRQAPRPGGVDRLPTEPVPAKGKGRAVETEDGLDDFENSPPSPRFDQLRMAKKPRLEGAQSPAVAAAARPARRSAADAAFEFAVSKQHSNSADRASSPVRELARAPPVRTKSAPDRAEEQLDRHGRAQPLFRSSASPEKNKHGPETPSQEEVTAPEEELAWPPDMHLDAGLFATESTSAEDRVRSHVHTDATVRNGGYDGEGGDATSLNAVEEADIEVVGFTVGSRPERKQAFTVCPLYMKSVPDTRALTANAP